jgi:DNA mismatch repair protein MutS2
MDNNTERDYRVLELGKILEMLAAKCSCADTAEEARRIQPQTELNKVHEMLQQTSDAYMLAGRFGTPGFSGAPHISNAHRRAQSGAVLSMGELLRIASVMRTIRLLRDWRSHCEGVSTSLDGLFMTLASNNRLEEKIFTSIDSPEEMNDRASAELYDIRRKIKNAESRVRQQLDNLIRSATYQKYLQESLVTMRDGRFVVPVKAEFRSQVAGLVHDTSSSGATVFIEPMAVVETNNDIKLLKGREQEEIERILTALSVECGENADMLIGSYRNMIELDLLFAKANLAYDMDCSLPVVKADGIIDLKKARHPLIHKKKVVPSDIRLGEEFDTLMITGPNTGGKTVSIKTIGLLTLMAECGLFIPANDNSALSVFENVLCDIGEEQSIEQSLSTFSAHMTKIVEITQLVNDKTLVLIDELGAGTDPVEGAALAVAILEYLRSKGARIAATTHYSELKEYALRTPRVENASCEFDVDSLKPTYRLLIGIPGRSNAFAISARLKLPREIIDEAENLVSDENSRFEDVVDTLEKTRNEMEAEKQKTADMQAEIDRIRQSAEKKLIDAQRKSEQEITKAQNEAKKIVENAKRAANSLMMEIDMLKKEQQKEKNASEMARKARAAMRSKLNDVDDILADEYYVDDDEDYKLPRELKVGDRVRIASLGVEGEVLSINGDTVEVQAGIMKTKADMSDMRLLGEKKAPVQNKQRSVKPRSSVESTPTTAKSSVDLRGMDAETALMELDRYIDSAIRLGLNEFTVIHGKGTGVLRKAVQQHLKSHPSIKSHRLGVYGEGEDGVTIAELK